MEKCQRSLNFLFDSISSIKGIKIQIYHMKELESTRILKKIPLQEIKKIKIAFHLKRKENMNTKLKV